MADASDSKSDVGDYVWVQVPSPAGKIRMTRLYNLVILIYMSRRTLEPKVQGLLGINAFVGRFTGKNVHRTFFYFRLTPSPANIKKQVKWPVFLFCLK